MTGGLAALAVIAARPALAVMSPAAMPQTPRTLTFENLHTGEKLSTAYWADGGYVKDGLTGIARVLRDHRTGAVHPIDPRLLDLLATLRTKLEARAPFQVISGYRSPESNAQLHAASSGVATRSLHMDGMAIDVRVAGVALQHLRDAAKSLNLGGVGFYPQSNFVHVDVGRVRYW